MTAAIVDTGPLVALLDRSERHHDWVVERFKELDAPLPVCEPVLAETMYRKHGRTSLPLIHPAAQ
jgi:predicted nucleic acid-binding protein